MKLGSFTLLPKSSLGIDIGTSAIKVIEISSWGQRKTLKNYGELKAATLYAQPFRKFEKNSLSLSSKDIARAIRAIFQEAKISQKEATFSLPDFSSFFTHFELPQMTKDEIPDAVQFEARKHIPLSLSEVTFDWQIIEGKPGEKNSLKILLVAVPNEVIHQYQEIANLASLRLLALEAEVFGLIRAVMHEQESRGAVLLLDIGAQSTTINLVYKKKLRVSHSLDIAGDHFTERIAQSLSIDTEKAEEQKIAKGMEDEKFAAILLPLIDVLLGGIQKVIQDFSKAENEKNVEKILLAGGSSKLLGLREYIEKNIAKVTEIARPFQTIFYPPILEKTLKDSGGAYAVALGMALRSLQ